MQPQELVDINIDFQSRRERLKRRLLRIIIPFGGVILIVAAILAIAIYSYYNNRRETLERSQDVLEALDRQIHSELNAFLLPASNLVRIGAETVREYLDEIWSPSRTPFGLQVFRTYPQLSGFFTANPRGSIVNHRQNPDGTINTEVIEREMSNVRVTRVYRDEADNVVNTETSSNSDYDPRVRPWYKEAVEGRKLYWSEVYIFFTEKLPGLTVSYPLFSQNDELMAVIGIDIKLDKISTFLANLKVGINGRAIIIEDDGTLVAYPETVRTYQQKGDTLDTVMLDELGDPVLTRAFNRFKIDGHGRRELVVDGQRYLNTVTSLKSTVGRDWSVMLIVPEDDFVGFLRDNLQKVLLMTIVIVIIAGILASLLVRQGLRADRNALLVLERKQQIEAQSRAFSELASKTSLWDPEDIASLEELTEIVSATMAVRRASAWGYYEDENTLKCEDSFDRGSNGHTQGTVLKIDDYPKLFQELIEGKDLIIADTASDPRTSELHRVYLGPLGCTSLLAIPVMPHGKLVGVIWFEHEETIRAWKPESISFARSIASLLALRLAANRRPDDVAQQDQNGKLNGNIDESAPATPDELNKSVANNAEFYESKLPKKNGELQKSNSQKISFSERLLKRGLSQNSSKADIYDNVTVLVLRFTDPVVLAEYFGGDNPTTAVDHLICHFEERFDVHRIDYWKLIGDQIICASGMQDNSTPHVHAIADLALNFQDKCSHLFADLDKRMEFKIGIDTGGIIGSPVGRQQQSYNIWGEAVSTASKMADKGVTGGIQVSETAYRGLQQNYLFKVRGRYYLPNIGEISTYLLTGRM